MTDFTKGSDPFHQVFFFSSSLIWISCIHIGQGKGYYDRFIEKMRSGGRLSPILMAVGLTPSFIEDGIPMMEHDYFMNCLILPDEILHFREV